jgi:hypothetical protein
MRVWSKSSNSNFLLLVLPLLGAESRVSSVAGPSE